MFETLKKAAKRMLSQEIATRSTDPNFYGALHYLPNPDAVLRKMGKSHEVYDAIVSDAHVIGDLRSIRSGLLSYEWQLNAGGMATADVRALEFCEKVFSQPPAPGMQWSDVIWNMAHAVFRGYRVHEVVWQRFDNLYAPVKIVDRPERRFVFSPDNELRLLTRTAPVSGEALEDFRFLVARHMPSFDNPYGVALFSSCFWPYTFKHSGFRYFVKFCEKYGIPWAVGKAPRGTPKDQQDAFADSLAAMIEDAVAVIPDDGSVELLSVSSSGELVHERLVNICNREMSKALTSQTLATEIQGNGSRAAAETHRGREQSVNESDRHIIEDKMNELLRWMTEINFAGAMPPTFEFFEEAEARKDWVEVLDGARQYLDVPVWFAHERLQIPPPEPGDLILPRSVQAQGLPSHFSQSDYAAGTAGAAGTNIDPSPVTAFADQLAAEAGDPIKQLLDVLRAKADSAETLEALRDDLLDSYGDLDSGELVKIMQYAFAAAELSGRFDVAGES